MGARGGGGGDGEKGKGHPETSHGLGRCWGQAREDADVELQVKFGSETHDDH